MEKVKSEALYLTQELIKFNSFEEKGKFEILDFVMNYLGDDVPEKQVYNRENAPFFIARIGDKREDGFRLILQGHLDVVPEGFMPDAFSPKLTEDRVIGRGASDMKSGCACSLAAFKQAAFKKLTRGEIYLVFTTDEEFSSQMIKEVLESYLPSGDLALVGEPSKGMLGIGSKGNLWVDVEINGVAGHGSAPEAARNSIEFGVQFLNELFDYRNNELPKKHDEIFGLPTYSVGSFNAGEFPNIIPDYCKIQLDRRYVTGETNELILNEINDALAKAHQKLPGFKTEVTRWEYEWPVYCYPTDSPGYQRILNALSKIDGFEPKAEGVAYWGEGGYINEKTPAIYFGPGNIDDAHSSHEFVLLKDLYDVAEGYMRIIDEFCL